MRRARLYEGFVVVALHCLRGRPGQGIGERSFGLALALVVEYIPFSLTPLLNTHRVTYQHTLQEFRRG